VTLEEWVEALSAELDVEPDVVDVRLLLDVARDAAHQVHRTAAPLTTFLVGYAAATRGGGADAVADAAATAQRLAATVTPDPDG
jgi:hypothetical protein